MVELLAAVIIISIAFGVSLQSAFWGLMSFVFGVVGLCIVMMFAEVGLSIIATKIKYRKPGAHKKAIHELRTDAKLGLMFLCAVSPLLVAVLLGTLCNQFTIDYPIQTFFICIAPLVAGVAALVVKIRKSKKHANR